MQKALLVICATLLSLSSMSQDDFVKIKGLVVDLENGAPLLSMMAVDKKSGSGTFGGGEGRFVINMQRGDTLLVGAIGYETISFAIPPSGEAKVIEKTFYMERLVVNLPLVEVIPDRELREIEEDIQKLGYRRSDYQLSGIDAIASPITFLYQSFSKRERSKRKLAELQNEDRKRDLLKELFKRYIDYDIITLENDEFDDFVDFCNVSDHFMKSSTQYDFLVYIKKRFKEYRRSPEWIQHRYKEDDYYKD